MPTTDFDIDKASRIIPLVPGLAADQAARAERRAARAQRRAAVVTRPSLPANWHERPELAERVHAWQAVADKHLAATDEYRQAEAGMATAVDEDLRATGEALAAGKRDPGTPRADKLKDKLADTARRLVALQRHADNLAEQIAEWFTSDVRPVWEADATAQLAEARERMLVAVEAARDAHRDIAIAWTEAHSLWPGNHQGVPQLPDEAFRNLKGDVGGQPELLFNALDEFARERAITEKERTDAWKAELGVVDEPRVAA